MQTAAGHTQLPIWPGAALDAAPVSGPESVEPGKNLNSGRPWLVVIKVVQPTITVYSPKVTNKDAAVVIFPGGVYPTLAIDLEGTEVCDWLVAKGITCVLLKYCVPQSGPHWERTCECEVNAKATMALQDAQRSMGLGRLHAAQSHIEPYKIGVLGVFGWRASGG